MIARVRCIFSSGECGTLLGSGREGRGGEGGGGAWLKGFVGVVFARIAEVCQPGKLPLVRKWRGLTRGVCDFGPAFAAGF